MLSMRAACISLALFLAQDVAGADFPFHHALRNAVSAWREAAPMPLQRFASDAEAESFRADFVAALEAEVGAQIGFKAALTNPAAQRRFGIDRPVLGVLLDGMILPNAATVSIRRASRMLIEADLLVVVRNESFNEAESDEALAESLSHVAPFMELADGLFPPGWQPDAQLLVAFNAGARLGVRGALVSLPDPPAKALEMLRGISAELIGPGGAPLGAGRAADLLGDPIHAARWIRDEARRLGYRFAGGEQLSLGSLSAPFPVGAPGRYTARYVGFPAHAESVAVELTDP